MKKVLAKMREFQAKIGEDFKPAPLLEKLAAEGGAFAIVKKVTRLPSSGASRPLLPRGRRGTARSARRMRAAPGRRSGRPMGLRGRSKLLGKILDG